MFNAQSEFQLAQIIDTSAYGKTLVLDGKTQSALLDEPVYHESLVHPSMLLHENPKSVYIGGGGELATAREVLRHSSVEKCVMVDIDETVVNISKEHLPEWHGGCIDDPRLELHYEDAKGYLERDDRTYDVIIMDIADPIEAGPGYVLYTKEFCDFAVTKLNPGGILVTQSGPGSLHNVNECFGAIHRTLQQSFDFVVPYAADIPSFGSNWAYNVAFNKDSRIGATVPEGTNPAVRVMEFFVPSDVDRSIEERIRGGNDALKYLDGVSMHGIFGLPKQVRKAIAEEKRVITVDNPVFMY